MSEFRRFEIIQALAGSGKTHKLAIRYIRLLAMNASPDSILATTFSKKAAGEIRDRVLEMLSSAVTNEEARASLLTEVPELNEDQLQDALVLMTSQLHKLKIGTIDSFFVRTAQSFQDTLGMHSDWSILDDSKLEPLFQQAVIQITNAGKNLGKLATAFQWGLGGSRVPIVSSLKEVYDNAYRSIRESGGSAWLWGRFKKLPKEDAVNETLQNFASLMLSDKRLQMSIPKSVEAFKSKDWNKFLTTGMPSKVFDGSNKYYVKLSEDLIETIEPLVEFASIQFANQLLTKNKGVFDVNVELNEAITSLKHIQGLYTFDDIAFYLSQCNVMQLFEELQFRLDLQVDHMLIDEFQDTSVTQYKVLQPLIQEINQSESDRSLFFVGDVKQSLYSFRGGEPELLRNLPDVIQENQTVQLEKSWRCSRPVLNAVNTLFGNVNQIPQLDELSPRSIAKWQKDFLPHEPAVSNRKGYACIQTVEGIGDVDEVELMIQKSIDITKAIHQKSPNATIGILVQKNTKQQIQRIVHGLRNDEDQPVLASEHRGNPLTDAPAVTVLMSLLLMADHPGNTVARFHVCTSPIGKEIGLLFSDEGACLIFGKRIRLQLLKNGYASVLKEFAMKLAPFVSERDNLRMWQLIEYSNQVSSDSYLRPSSFINDVMQTNVPDPASSKVQVMTIHASKGLSFDAVILCDLQQKLSNTPKILTYKEDPCESPTLAGIYCGKVSENVLDEYCQLRQSHDDEVVNDTLCTLYVAMTRAKHALHIVVPSREKLTLKTFDCVLLNGIGVDSKAAGSIVWEAEGNDSDWGLDLPEEPFRNDDEPIEKLLIKEYCGGGAARGRGVLTQTPSGLEGGGETTIRARYSQSDTSTFDQGALLHHWLEQIDWFDTLPNEAWFNKYTPSNFQLRMGADRISAATKIFMDALQSIEFQQLLTPEDAFSEVHQEYPFLVRLHKGTQLGALKLPEMTDISGTIDRLVIYRNADGNPISADIIDWKSDRVDASNMEQKVNHYAPQLATYAIAISKLLHLPLDSIQTKLVFLRTNQIIDLKNSG